LHDRKPHGQKRAFHGAFFKGFRTPLRPAWRKDAHKGFALAV
jgi:hypothetical protein